MEILKILIDSAIRIMEIQINVIGYNITLMGVLCYTGALYLVFRLVFGLFK